MMIFMTSFPGDFRADMVLKFAAVLPPPIAKVFSERAQVNTPLPKKKINPSPAMPCSVRKALGNVNRTGVTIKMEKTNQKPQPYNANKVGKIHFCRVWGNAKLLLL